jgi:hypothetical protein
MLLLFMYNSIHINAVKENEMEKISLYFGVFLGLICAPGWVRNIFILAVYTPDVAHWGGMEALRVIGIFFAPLGAVIGWF